MFFHVMLAGANPTPKFPTRGQNATGEIVDPDAVGYDLYACISGTIPPLSRRMIPLGFAAAFTPGYVGKLFDRSGMGNKGMTIFAGVMDPGYRDEWKVILYNSESSPFSFKVGDRIAQVLFLPVGLPDVTEVSALEDSVRGVRGIGSSGL